MVQCKDTRSRTIFQHRVETDSHGEFNVHLPFPVSKHVTKIRGCSVRLVNSNRPYCAIAASAASSALRRLKSRKDGTRVFSAGFFTFRPLKQPDICDENKPSIKKFKKLSQISNPDDPAFLPPIQDPPSSYGSFLPPLPPLPQLPRLPPLPGIPFLPPLVPEKKPANDVTKLKENEAADDAILFTPNSFDLRVTLPPLFPSPNSPPLLNLPPIHGLTPSLPPPPPFGLPPFPFPPTTPGFPGLPLAEVSAASEKTAP